MAGTLRRVGPTPEEAAAALAAIELFIAETSPVLVADEQPKMNPWYRAGLLESVNREPERL
jgi:hypothetical protein